MADEPRWEDLLGEPEASASHPETQPLTRRAAREAETSARHGGRGSGRPPKSATRRRRRWPAVVISLLVVLGLIGGGVAYAWMNYETQIRKVLGWELPPPDFEGEGNGETTIIVRSGDSGVEVTQALVDAGVVKDFDTFYALLLIQDPQVQFFPGVYTLKSEMSSAAALKAIQDPANRVEHTALIHEGRSLDQVFDILSAATDIPVEDFKAEAKDAQSFGVPKAAPSLEGYLFPATYRFDPGLDARTVLQTLVDRTFTSLDNAGVAEKDRHRVLTIASLIQREAGPVEKDFYKVSRVIKNRLDSNWKLQFDSTSHYGYAWKHGKRLDGGVFSNSAELNDDNAYNTYVHTGLPLGPIGAAGDLAIDAALNPVKGPWFFFVTVNLDTGETQFSETQGQHEAAVAKLRAWCQSTQSPNCK